MKIIFTRNSYPFSRFLRWGLNEPVSHVALVFDNKIVFHSNFKGVHVEWINSFKKSNEIVFEINIDESSDDKAYYDIIDNYDNKSYDFGALFYLILHGFLYKLFNKPLPDKNLWGSRDNLLCVELIGAIKNLNLTNNLSIISPYQLYILLKDRYGK